MVVGVWTFLLAGTAVGQDMVTVSEGETVTVNLPVRSSLEMWEAKVQDPTIGVVESIQRGDTITPTRLLVRGLNSGQTPLTADRYLETVSDRRQTASGEFVLEVTNPQSSTDQVDREDQSASSPPPPQNQQPDTSEASGVVQEVRQLLQRERYDLARQVVNEELEDSTNDAARQLLQLQARSYREEQNYEQEAASFQQIIDDYAAGREAHWRVQRAEALRRAGRLDEAELILVRLQYQNRGDPAWFDAMIQLSRLERDRGNPQAALELLQNATDRASMQRRPLVWLELARLRDQETAVRDMERAHELYDSLIPTLKSSHPGRVEEVRNRRDRIESEYLDYGVN